jgi:hypothetical protein
MKCYFLTIIIYLTFPSIFFPLQLHLYQNDPLNPLSNTPNSNFLSILKYFTSYNNYDTKQIPTFFPSTIETIINTIQQFPNTTITALPFPNLQLNHKTSFLSILNNILVHLLSNQELLSFFNQHQLNILQGVEYLTEQTNQTYSFKQLPEPYTSDDTPCNKETCSTKKLKWMKGTVLSVSLRTSYEFVNIIIHILGKIAWGTCGCVDVGALGKKHQVKCALIRSYPGVPCNVMVSVLKGMFKISLLIWKGYISFNSLNTNPINPF